MHYGSRTMTKAAVCIDSLLCVWVWPSEQQGQVYVKTLDRAMAEGHRDSKVWVLDGIATSQ